LYSFCGKRQLLYYVEEIQYFINEYWKYVGSVRACTRACLCTCVNLLVWSTMRSNQTDLQWRYNDDDDDDNNNNKSEALSMSDYELS